MYWHEEQQSQANWRLQWRLQAYVLALHASFFCLLAISPYTHMLKPPPRKLVVHTVSLSPAVISKPIEAPAQIVQERAREMPQEILQEMHQEMPAPPPKEKAAPQSPIEPTAAIQEAPKKEEPKPIIPSPPKPKLKPEIKPQSKPQPKPTIKKQPVPVPKPTAKPKPKPTVVDQKKRQKETKSQQDNIKQEKLKQEKEKQARLDKEKKQQEQLRQEKLKQEKLRQEKIKQEKIKQEKIKQEEAKKAAMISDALASLNRTDSLSKQKAVQNSAKSRAALNSGPSQIQTLSSDSLIAFECDQEESFSAKEKSYYDELIRRLKLYLKLPEYSEVKLELTLARSGKVTRVKCVKSKSQKNISYLEKTIPSLVFPPFGNNFPNEKEHLFRIRLVNTEINY